MAYIALYWSMMLMGYMIGSRCRSHKDRFGFIQVVMLVCVSALVLLMGIRMGANEEVIANLATIGIRSLLITVILMAGTVGFVTAARKITGLDRYGRLKEQKKETDAEHDFPPSGSGMDLPEKSTAEEEKSSNLMTWLILIFTALGILIGYFAVGKYVSDIEWLNHLMGNMMTTGLCILLFFIGLEMGLSGTVAMQLKQIGFRVLVFPVAVLIGTAVMGVVISLLFSDLSVRESLAICFGFGWYTFAPVTISGAGYTIAGAISFLHNVMRELAGIVLIPVLAKRIGYIEVTSLPGVAAMDICMPIVGKATRPDIMVYSFAIGITANLAVPLFVPLFLGI